MADAHTICSSRPVIQLRVRTTQAQRLLLPQPLAVQHSIVVPYLAGAAELASACCSVCGIRERDTWHFGCCCPHHASYDRSNDRTMSGGSL